MEHDDGASARSGDHDEPVRPEPSRPDETVEVAALPHHSRAVVPPRRSGNLHGVNEAQRWADFGRFVAERREQLSLSRRAAAKKAKLPEPTLRALELGYRTAYGGVRVLPNLANDDIERLAEALEMEATDLRGRLGRAAPRLVTAGEPDSRTTALARRIARLDEADRQIVELLVERLSPRE